MIQLPFKPQAIVLANGEIPIHPFALRLLHEIPCIVCCDGAANNFITQGGKPSYIIGDGDSISSELKQKSDIPFIPITEQETNDLTKAVHFLQQKGFSKIVILGATGKREDHTLGNISLLMDYRAEQLQCAMITNTGIFLPCNDNTTFQVVMGQAFSLFNFGAKKIIGHGLVYPLRDFTQWWQGTLNKAEKTTVSIEAEGSYLVFLPFDSSK